MMFIDWGGGDAINKNTKWLLGSSKEIDVDVKAETHLYFCRLLQDALSRAYTQYVASRCGIIDKR
jgi:hypothetical protein